MLGSFARIPKRGRSQSCGPEREVGQKSAFELISTLKNELGKSKVKVGVFVVRVSLLALLILVD